jgi:hypothetical protein
MQGCLSYLIGVLVLVDGVMQHQSREQMYLANGLQRLALLAVHACDRMQRLALLAVHA